MIPQRVTLIIPRLATDHIGELVAARDAIARSLEAVGLDWHDLAAACAAPLPHAELNAKPSPAYKRSASFGDLARAARDMVAKGFALRPSARQAAWLDAILDRLQRRAA